MYRLLPQLLLFVALCAEGCVPIKAGHGLSDGAEPQTTPQGNPLAVSISQIMPGATVNMATPFGESSDVWAGPVYKSGLGIPCRHAVIGVHGAQQRLAVCNGSQGWYIAEPVFDSTL